jgi:hypothetical protein
MSHQTVCLSDKIAISWPCCGTGEEIKRLRDPFCGSGSENRDRSEEFCRTAGRRYSGRDVQIAALRGTVKVKLSL